MPVSTRQENAPPETETCCICLDALTCDSNDVTSMPCGHKLHTNCALQAAWRGHSACPLCRQLPVSNDLDQVARMTRRRESIEHNRIQMQRFFRKGMNSRSNTPVLLKKAVTKYKRHAGRMSDYKIRAKNLKCISKKMKEELKDASKKIKQKYEKDIKALGGRFCEYIHCRATPNKCIYSYETRRLRQDVALAAGWTPVSVPDNYYDSDD